MELQQVKSALFGDNTGKIKTFAVLSAENPMSVKLSRHENKERMDRIESDMKNLGLQYTKITGMYNNKENLFVIYNISYKDALHFASVYAQESFFFAENNYPAIVIYYETTYKLKPEDDIKTLIVPEETYKKISEQKDVEDYFSRYGSFEFDMDYFNESVEEVRKSIINEDYEYYINRAVDDNLTPRGRANARRKARHNI